MRWKRRRSPAQGRTGGDEDEEKSSDTSFRVHFFKGRVCVCVCVCLPSLCPCFSFLLVLPHSSQVCCRGVSKRIDMLPSRRVCVCGD